MNLSSFSQTPLGKFLKHNLSIDELNKIILSYDKIFNVCSDDGIKIKEIKNLAVDSITRILNEFSQDFIDVENDLQRQIFVAYFNEFQNQMISNLTTPESQKLKINYIINRLDALNKRNQPKIEKQKKILNTANVEFQEKNFPKEIRIENYLKEMEEKDEAVDTEIQAKIYDANVKMIRNAKSRIEVVNFLSNDEKDAENFYQKYLQKNLIEQKKLMEQKFKAEQALQTILLKFDSDIGSRVHEIDLIEDEMNTDKKKFEIWKSTIFAQQEIKYKIIMKEKEEEETRERNIRVEEMRQEHAVKVIQRHMRKFLKKQKKNKNKKKNLKKKN